LFADVELRKGDDIQRLAEFGLSLEKKAANRLLRNHAPVSMASFAGFTTSDRRAAGPLNVVC